VLGSGTGTEMPNGWTELRSTAHLVRKAMTADAWRAFDGEFKVHLCPEHPDRFAAHQPRTDRSPGGRGTSIVYVSCSCGGKFGHAQPARLVGDKPHLNTERLWWAHLPADLRWYATREAVADADR
jgi:hypothetical protein